MSSFADQIEKDVQSMLKKYNAKDCITKDEAISYFKNSGSKFPERNASYLFKAMDLDHDGKLTLDEIRAGLIKEYSEKLEDTIELDIDAFFLKHDINKDQKIHKKEMIQYFEDLGTQFPSQAAEAIFKDIDTDKDNVITPNELEKVNILQY
ncbi:hypothetical protein DICPUDRAFT_77398 [Dictyostelium purpureum]|uniref:EF-hand domain-containing protein n=1 Tax=Dictyostelium purpureum TaxID=5786 RepID=F0ZGH6_DICPU|nr:uncharacterized protein DICPUDRAFT_77398 [Dictyostelium purpureum]EGC36957.1 hypothetical protein DICPUDRAFT_77398 [Dictyostelium purpureum]|eukprot:XP_003286525.1 hypothetical protein DICPUDRAFT_77398 [Dictyostelium purpureum]